MSIQITADRVRSMIADCRTAKQVVSVLRSHCVRFRSVPFSDNYNLNIHIPCKTGIIRIYQPVSGSRRPAPFTVQLMTPVTFSGSGVPVFRPSVPVGSPFTEL